MSDKRSHTHSEQIHSGSVALRAVMADVKMKAALKYGGFPLFVAALQELIRLGKLDPNRWNFCSANFPMTPDGYFVSLWSPRGKQVVGLPTLLGVQTSYAARFRNERPLREEGGVAGGDGNCVRRRETPYSTASESEQPAIRAA